MKWQAKTALIALAILTPVLVWWLYPHESEPTYQGRTLNEWVVSEWFADNGSPQAEEAIIRIGTNGLPFLVKWAAYVPPRRHFLRLFGIDIPLHMRDRKAELAQVSYTAFRILGPRAVPAIPDLVRLLKGTNTMVAARALSSIDEMDMEGVPALLDFVTNRHAYASRKVLRPINGMRNLGTNGALVVPILTQCLNSSDSTAAGTAALLLANIGEHIGMAAQTDAIVAALIEATASGDKNVRFCAVFALGRLGAYAQSGVPAVKRAMADPDVQVRSAATNSLKRIAPLTLEERGQEHNP